ncbi:MAG TPA: zf-HC2 domain-containing protein, partial [Streptosporangiaceae bacterium]
MRRHLGERLSALIDGELSHAQRERVLAHLARCDSCRREAGALRLLKRRMHALGDSDTATADPAGGDALTWRLLALVPAAGRGPGPRRPPRWARWR